MQFVGDSIVKIEATRGEKIERPLSIKANVKITDVQKKELFAADEKKEGAVISYSFEIAYGEKTGKIIIDGQIFVVGDKKDLKKLEDEWVEKGKVEDELVIPALNRAMELGYLAAIPLAKELKLPTPIKMPRFAKENKVKKEEETGQAG